MSFVVNSFWNGCVFFFFFSRACAHRRLSCVWKLLGDTCVLVSQLPVPLNHLVVPHNIVRLSGTDELSAADHLSWRTEKLEGARLLELAARSVQSLTYLTSDVTFPYSPLANMPSPHVSQPGPT